MGSLQKTSGHNKFNKMAVYAAGTCGMIRDHPDMLRRVGLHCVPSPFCMGRKEAERMDIMLEEEKLLCWATKQKESDSLYPIQRGGEAHRSPGHASGASRRARPRQTDWTMAGRQGSLWKRRAGSPESCGQLEPGPDFSLETCTF